MVDICKCCGAVLPPDPPGLTPKQRKVFRFIKRHPGASMDDLMTYFYSDHMDGGPLKSSSLQKHIQRVNQRLIDTRIIASNRGPGCTYRITKLDAIQ